MIVAIVTLYNPENRNIDNLNRISQQVDMLYVCDNSSQVGKYDWNKNVIYLCDGNNYGLSVAFNRVLTKYEFSMDDYIIFFDQDSTIETGHIEKLIAEYQRLEKMGVKMGCIGPSYFNTNSNQIEKPRIKTIIDENVYAIDSIITSSMLCQYSTLQKIGFWNEEVFLDLADWDICWRMCEKGYTCCVTKNVLLTHTLGKSQISFGPFRLKEDVPIRAYYQTRESLVLMKKKYAPLRCKIRLWLTVYVRPWFHLTFFGNRKERLKYILRAKKDYRKQTIGVYVE